MKSRYNNGALGDQRAQVCGSLRTNNPFKEVSSIKAQQSSATAAYSLSACIPLLIAVFSLPLFLLGKSLVQNNDSGLSVFFDNLPFILMVVAGLLNPFYQIALSGRFSLRRNVRLSLCWAMSLSLSCAYPYAAYFAMCVAPVYFLESGPYDSLGNALSLYITWAVAAIAVVIASIGLAAIACVKIRRKQKAMQTNRQRAEE